ncbi:MAG: DNA polymerase III subunit alpha [Bdellovibrionales bacterium]|nr:DNA polymerase III subunit alpha [Bdellovibrionales bacterium]
MSFVHLNTHSHYSPLQASSTVPGLIKKCVDFGMPALALTDYGNMFGALEFYFQAREHNIKPLMGLSAYYVEDRFQKKHRPGENFRQSRGDAKTLNLLAKNNTGYKNLCMLGTLSWKEGFYFVPRADYKLFEKYSEGVIAVTAGQRGSVAWFYKNKGVDRARREIQQLKKIFKDSFYLGFQPEGVEGSREYNVFLAEMSESEKIPLVAENDVHYLEKKDSVIQDVLFCIGINRTLGDRERERLGPSEFFFKSQKEMRNQFKSEAWEGLYQTACDRTLEVAERCSIQFQDKDKAGRPIYHLPRSVKGEKKGAKTLRELTSSGLKKRFQEAAVRGEIFTPEQKKHYEERINYELEIIENMGFSGYFQIVEDFIRWAKSHQIPVGPGRGSGSSSLVSFCLGITDLDPIPLNLIFERFLNPERISMPDFDIDFCQENRSRVIQYITEKYGSDCTSHIITYGRLNVRAAIRDAGRVLGLSYEETDRMAKLIPDKLGITLKEALKLEPRFKAESEENPQIKELLHVTEMLEGLIRHTGIHAAGIIIADTPITDYAPLYRGAEGENVLQYDLKYAEKIGLVKFDFLGLKTLTHIAETFRLIEITQGKKITPEQISLKNPGIYEIMCQGDTVGVFQFEGRGITDLLIKSQPTCFEDIIAINALYRPGPMNMIPSYLERKKGRVPVQYMFSELEPILKETYGIIVYQEQVQQIAVKIAGYSYGEADILRRAMGKKIQSVMNRQKERFLNGAKEANYNLKKSEKLFDLIAEFAKYGFPKSHAAAYCVLAAQTAWLKRYYPVEFFASQMTIDKRDSDKVSLYIEDARKHEVAVLPPHINHSGSNFSVEEHKVRFALGAVKGVGDSSARAIVRVREGLEKKKFSSVEEFFDRMDPKSMNRKTFESLVKAGAFDGFGTHRREIFENYEKFLQRSTTVREAREAGQQSLFASGEDVGKEDAVQLTSVEPWSFEEKMHFEKEVIGFYLSDHPLRSLKGLEHALDCNALGDINRLAEGKSVQVLALIRDFKEVLTKKSSKMMAFANLEDGMDRMEVIFFPDIYKKISVHSLQEGVIVLIKGVVQRKGDISGRIIAEDLIPLEERFKSIHQVCLSLYPDMEEQDLTSLRTILKSSQKGSAKVSLRVCLPEEKTLVEIAPEEMPQNVQVNRELIEKIYKVLKSPHRIQLF